jgi:hypothetical protein
MDDAIKAEQQLGQIQDQNFEDFRRGEKMKMDLANQAALTSLTGIKRERMELENNHQQRLQQISETRFATAQQYEDALALEEQLHQAEIKRFEDQHNASELLKLDLKEIERTGVQAFSQGLATAIVGAFEEGDKAFQKFAANFLKEIAKMILQALILRALQSFGFGLSSGGQASALAGGGMRFAADGLQEVSAPTFFPKFNVLAGEAGREVLTVLARPRFERVNGIPAQIGMAGGRRLAITSADALEGARHVNIKVTLSPGLKAEIVENSVEGARVAIAQDMGENTAISRATRKLTQ